MKVRCITTQGKGLVFKDSSVGLTEGKVYTATAIQVAMSTSVGEENVRFFVYNDNQQWVSYKPYFFASE